MNFTPFAGHFQTVHQFAAAKFNTDQLPGGTMLVTAGADGTLQYIRHDQNGTNFITAGTANGSIQLPITIPTPINIPVSSSRSITTLQQQVQAQIQQSQTSNIHQNQLPPQSQQQSNQLHSTQQQQQTQHPQQQSPHQAQQQEQQQQSQQTITAVVNHPALTAKYHHPSGAILSWSDLPVINHFNETGKNIATINVPYTTPTVNAAAILAVQQGQTGLTSGLPANVWPVKLMQNASTMTVDESELQQQESCKDNGQETKENTVIHNLVVKQETKDSGESDDDSDESSTKSDAEDPPSPSDIDQQKSLLHTSSYITSVGNGNIECHQIQLQQQGTAMADYLARLPAAAISIQHLLKYQTETNGFVNSNIKKENESNTNISAVLPGGAAIAPVLHDEPDVDNVKLKKKKKDMKKPPRPRPGEIRISTALDGSTLYCCPECHMAYPDREMLEQHLAGHKMERRFVCNVCGAGLKRKEHLDQHKRGHSDERPFVCNVCLKGFKRNEHLTRHYVIHSGDKSHCCLECGKKFSRKDHLHKHAQTHIAKRVKAELTQAGPEGNVPPNHHLSHPVQLHLAMS